ncbi:MAG: hypothetical protein GY845_25575 [Planctomycetes bacterium]|nr:hypothetical protein [Planctomycetota bacterium]
MLTPGKKGSYSLKRNRKAKKTSLHANVCISCVVCDVACKRTLQTPHAELTYEFEGESGRFGSLDPLYSASVWSIVGDSGWNFEIMMNVDSFQHPD